MKVDSAVKNPQRKRLVRQVLR